jgi:diaminohydroxyphosphoribosylaminopyrimidine deaminase/5-amino-6-(5-phosphoribosylamino)uracil reductase
MPAQTIIVTTNKAGPSWSEAATRKGAEILLISEDRNGLINLHHLLDELGNRKITSLLVEGGMKTHISFFREELVNKIHIDLASVIIGDFNTKKLVKTISYEKNKYDYRFTAYLKE